MVALTPEALPLLDGQKPCCLSQLDAMWAPVPGAGPGEPGLESVLHSSQGEPPVTKFSSITYTCGSEAAPYVPLPAPPTPPRPVSR